MCIKDTSQRSFERIPKIDPGFKNSQLESVFMNSIPHLQNKYSLSVLTNHWEGKEWQTTWMYNTVVWLYKNVFIMENTQSSLWQLSELHLLIILSGTCVWGYQSQIIHWQQRQSRQRPTVRYNFSVISGRCIMFRLSLRATNRSWWNVSEN